MKNILLSTLCVLIFASFAPIFAQKMTAEDVIAKHLESIGTKENRNALKDLTVAGKVSYTQLRTGGGGADGNAILASEGTKSLLGMNLSTPKYPLEKIGYDGNKLRVAFILPGTRSPLGNFFLSYDSIFKEGLFGGILSTGWSLNNLEARKAKVDFDGKRKVDGKEMYVLSYLPKSGSDVSIKLFFDTVTFQHLRTEYKRTISPGQGATVDASARQRESRQTLVEEFSANKNEKGLNLPHSYRLYLAFDGIAGTSEYEWKFEFSQFFFNQQLDAKSFNIETK